MSIPRPASLLAVLGQLGCLWLAQAALAQPLTPNDSFTNCTPLSGPGGIVAGNNFGATPEPGEPPNTPQPLYGSTVWWCWTAPSNGCFYFSTEGSGFDTVLCVFTGTAVSSLTTIGCNDDISPPARHSRVEFAARAGDSFKVRVDGYSGAQGNLLLRWDFSRPANDYFTNATIISGSSGAVSGNNCSATGEPGEPPNGPWPLYGRTVWWQWVAPAGGAYEFTTVGSSFDTVLCAFTGSGVGGLTAEACDDDYFGSGGASRVVVFTSAGTTHYFRIDGYAGLEGTTLLNWGRALTFGGLAHSSRGAAIMSVASNRLDISHLGPGGGDGVRIELGQSEGWRGSFRSLDLSPPNTMLRMVARGTVGSEVEHQVGLVRMYCSSNSALGVAADFSQAGSLTSTVEVRDRLGDVVSRFSVPNDTALTFQPVNPADVPTPCRNSFVLDHGRPTVWCRVCQPVAVLNPEPGGTGVVDMASYCIFADAPIAPVQSISSIELTGQGLDSFSLEDEALRVNGLFHRTSGNPLPGGIPRPGIWGDCDGDLIPSPPCPPIAIRFDWFDPGCGLCPSPRLETVLDLVRSYFTDIHAGGGPAVATQPGAYLRFIASGNLGGVSGTLGELLMTRGASNWTMTADFTPAGSASQRVELYNHGVQVAGFAGRSGNLASLPMLPDDYCGSGNPNPILWPVPPPPDPSFLAKWLESQLILLPNPPSAAITIMADEIRIVAENPSAPVRYLESFAIETAGIPSFSLSRERTQPAVLPPLQISRQTNGVLIAFPTEVNRTYELQYTTELQAGPGPHPWRVLQTIQGDGLMQTVLDPSVNGGIAGGGCRFYELRAPVGNGLE